MQPVANTGATVALRKESVDRNRITRGGSGVGSWSLSARRAWIEIRRLTHHRSKNRRSLSARRAWIEILGPRIYDMSAAVALRKESVDRNHSIDYVIDYADGRSPQGERG